MARKGAHGVRMLLSCISRLQARKTRHTGILLQLLDADIEIRGMDEMDRDTDCAHWTWRGRRACGFLSAREQKVWASTAHALFRAIEVVGESR